LPTQQEIRLAGLLVHHDIVSRETMEECFGICAKSAQPVSLSELLIDRGLLTPEEVEAFSDVPLTERQPIPNYRIEGVIGEGGMATIYQATYLPTEREVALKVMRPELARLERFRLRFFREAGILRHLDHPNIVKVYEDGHAGPYHFFAMQYVPGISLLDRIDKEGPLTENQSLKIVYQISDAMEMMVGRGVLHRDIKPGNILVTPRLDAYIIDLGLAKLVKGMREDGAEGTTVGTVEYISPEQARGREVDVRSDIYSLGVTLYHSVVGEIPFSGSDELEIMAKQILSSLKSPRLRNLTPLMRYFIEKMMAKERSHRYQSPSEIVADIEGHCGDIVATVDAEFDEQDAGEAPKIPKLVRRARRADAAPDRGSVSRRRARGSARRRRRR
jgi:eukaryotic-like serine/threonine-protein kinase